MLKFKYLMLITVHVLISGLVKAQAKLSLSGKVTVEKEGTAPATVFLSGTQRITTVDGQGKFSFTDLDPGNYELIVKTPGYKITSKSILLNGKNVDLDIKPDQKANAQQGGHIPDRSELAKMFTLFKTNFFGLSDNGLECRLLNPEAINFRGDYQSGMFTAYSDDFLIVESAGLGYRIKYLLNALYINDDKKVATYDGKYFFEEMEGSGRMKQKWQDARHKAYRGSLMHFLRSVYTDPDEALKQGFITQSAISQNSRVLIGITTNLQTIAEVDPRPLRFDTLVTLVDTSFISLRSKRALVVSYDPKKAALVSGNKKYRPGDTETVTLSKYISSMEFNGDELLIDGRGIINNRTALLIRGDWAGMRIGDLLPFEYQPPKVSSH